MYMFLAINTKVMFYAVKESVKGGYCSVDHSTGARVPCVIHMNSVKCSHATAYDISVYELYIYMTLINLEPQIHYH